ncbi:cache domain-containing protein [Rhizobium sp. G187]|uniref:cache domain-containing protein n=1 Tax=Rhizobium sp. G187 TaxID=3451352 RepID=UPI003EE49F10
MTLDRTLALVTATCLTLVLAAAATVVISGSRQQLAEGKRQEMQATALLLTSSMGQAASLSATQALQIGRDAQVIALLKAQDRAALAAYLKPSYEALASEAGVNMLHFHTTDIKSYLRVQDPKNFGQDLSSIRPMILAANRSRKLQKGLEVGLAGLSLRAVAPVMDGDTLIATFEVGVELKTLMDLAKSASGADFALFLSPAMSGYVPKDKAVSKDSTELLIESSTDTQLFEKLQAAGEIGLQREPVEGDVTLDSQRFGTLSQPLLDYSGRMIGTIVIARDITNLGSQFNRSLITALTVCILGFVFCYGVVMVTIRALVLRPIADLARYGQATTANPATAPETDGNGDGDGDGDGEETALQQVIGRLSALSSSSSGRLS